MRKKYLWILLLTVGILLGLLGRRLMPDGAEYLRREAARILPADVANWQKLEVIGRALPDGDFRSELVEALMRQAGEHGA